MPRRALVLVFTILLLPLPGLTQQPSRRFTPPLSQPSDRVLVLFFLATDCPISNRAFPEIQRLRSLYASQGVRIWDVYPNTSETPSNVHQHQSQFDPAGLTRLDPAGDLVALAHAHVTPEVAILVPSNHTWHPVYTGRIDDRYIHLGLQRPNVTAHFAEAAILAVLHNTPVPVPTGNPVGCAIMNPRAETTQP
jgi:hypothetical protein